MPNNSKRTSNSSKFIILTLFMFILVFLVNGELTKKYAFLGLDIWYKSMIPTLFPFMFIMNYIIKNDFTADFIKPVSLFLKPIFNISSECIFVIFFGFLCGFPLGAKSSISLYQDGKITKQEAEYLLCFTNNLGPAYLIGFVYHNILANTNDFITARQLLLIAFAVPFIYGLVLRYTLYLNKIPISKRKQNLNKKSISSPKQDLNKKQISTPKKDLNKISLSKNSNNTLKNYISSIPICLNDSLYQIGILGGYMILFNTFRVIPVLLFRNHKISYIFFQCLLEISGGLMCLKENIINTHNLITFTLTAFSFGGLSCYFQTNSIICETDISSKKYMLHKLVLCSITLILLLVLFH